MLIINRTILFVGADANVVILIVIRVIILGINRPLLININISTA